VQNGRRLSTALANAIWSVETVYSRNKCASPQLQHGELPRSFPGEPSGVVLKLSIVERGADGFDPRPVGHPNR
jgi:hypothetical protein